MVCTHPHPRLMSGSIFEKLNICDTRDSRKISWSKVLPSRWIWFEWKSLCLCRETIGSQLRFFSWPVQLNKWRFDSVTDWLSEVHRLDKSTLPLVVAVVNNISYVQGSPEKPSNVCTRTVHYSPMQSCTAQYSLLALSTGKYSPVQPISSYIIMLHSNILILVLLSSSSPPQRNGLLSPLIGLKQLNTLCALRLVSNFNLADLSRTTRPCFSYYSVWDEHNCTLV